MESFLPILLIVLAFVLLFVLPARQRKKIAERQATLQETLRIGTPIVLTCGLYGTVAALQEATLDVQAGPDTVLRFARAAILEVRSEPGPDATGSAGSDRVDLGKSGDS